VLNKRMAMLISCASKIFFDLQTPAGSGIYLRGPACGAVVVTRGVNAVATAKNANKVGIKLNINKNGNEHHS